MGYSNRNLHDTALHLVHRHKADLSEAELRACDIVASSYACDERWCTVSDEHAVRHSAKRVCYQVCGKKL